MIKKTVVCDKCEKGEPWVIIPKSDKLMSNTVLCKECAQHYYDLSLGIKCENCGKLISDGLGCICFCRTFCSPLCAIRYCEGRGGNDEQSARYFTDRDEKMLLGENEEELEPDYDLEKQITNLQKENNQ